MMHRGLGQTPLEPCIRPLASFGGWCSHGDTFLLTRSLHGIYATTLEILGPWPCTAASAVSVSVAIASFTHACADQGKQAGADSTTPCASGGFCASSPWRNASTNSAWHHRHKQMNMLSNSTCFLLGCHGSGVSRPRFAAGCHDPLRNSP